MSLKTDINLGTIVPLVVFMVAQTIGFVVWVVNESNNRAIVTAVIQQQLSEMRNWQERQDDRIATMNVRQRSMAQQQSAIITLLEFFKESQQ